MWMVMEEENTSLLGNHSWWLMKENSRTPLGVSVPCSLEGSRKINSEVSDKEGVNGEDNWR